MFDKLEEAENLVDAYNNGLIDLHHADVALDYLGFKYALGEDETMMLEI